MRIDAPVRPLGISPATKTVILERRGRNGDPNRQGPNFFENLGAEVSYFCAEMVGAETAGAEVSKNQLGYEHHYIV